MDYKKAYKEALERAKDYYKANQKLGDSDENEVLSDIFPELRESEDEMVRKEIIKLVKFYYGSSLALKHTVSKDEMVAWLEKQAQNTTITIPEDLKGTDTDGGVVGEKGEQGEQSPFNKERLMEVAKPETFEEKIEHWQRMRDIAEKRVKEWLEKQGEQRSKLVGFDYNAKDSDLQEVTYFIPNGFHAEMEGNKVVIKQGEQKPAIDFRAEDWCVSKVDGKIHNIYNSEVGPKFKVGDWITNGEYTWFIEGMHNRFYDIISPEGCGTDDTIIHIDGHFHLWTIEDAKDGDVLFIEIDGSTCIFKKLEGSLLYSHIISDGKLLVEDSHYYYETSDNIHPATKEQRDILFSKMKEAGYEWDADKKELRKMENSPILSNSSNTGKKWTEEDERAIGIIKVALTHPYNMDGKYDREFAFNWLKSLKQRMEVKV